MNKSYIVPIVFFLLTCCKTQSIENSLKKCINNELQKEAFESYGVKNFDFYKTMENIEKKLMYEGLLQGNDKNAYSLLINEIFDNKDDLNYRTKLLNTLMLLKENGIDINTYSSYSYILKSCPFEVITKKNKINSTLQKQLEIADQMEAKGFLEKALLNEYIATPTDEEYKKIVYRAPILFMIYKNTNHQLFQ